MNTLAPQGRIGWIDIARVIAILLVMQSHTTCSYLFNCDAVGGAVAMFFLISGFFTKNNTLRTTFARIGKLLPFYILWSLYAFLVLHHKHAYDWSFFLHALLHGHCAAMWFIHFLLCFSLIGYITHRLPNVLRGILIVALFALGTWRYSNGSGIHPCMDFCLGLSIFLLGQWANKISLSNWQSILFPSNVKACAIISVLIVACILTLSAFHITVIPSWLVIFPYMWSLLALAYAIDKQFPLTGKKLAGMGAAVVFIYAIHSPTLRIMISIHKQLLDTMPYHITSLFFVAILFTLGIFVYRVIKGKHRIIDMLLFAR